MSSGVGGSKSHGSRTRPPSTARTLVRGAVREEEKKEIKKNAKNATPTHSTDHARTISHTRSPIFLFLFFSILKLIPQ